MVAFIVAVGCAIFAVRAATTKAGSLSYVKTLVLQISISLTFSSLLIFVFQKTVAAAFYNMTERSSTTQSFGGLESSPLPTRCTLYSTYKPYNPSFWIEISYGCCLSVWFLSVVCERITGCHKSLKTLIK